VTKPRAIDRVGPDIIRITWSDGVVSEYQARQLRLACPCAACVEEWTGRALLDPNAVSPFLTIMVVDPVGRYALNFTFSDGHHTGIFSWERLRALAAAAPKDES
jgi:DUF971 family protein